MPRLNQQIPSQKKSSLERKFQKTMANLKTSEGLLPRSFLDRNSNLVPNYVATKTFKQGRTLHSVLCGEETNQKFLSSTSRKRDRIPFYRDVNRSKNSTNDSISLSGTQISSQIKDTTIGPRRRIEFSKAFGSIESNPHFDENGYAIPSATNSTPKIKISKDVSNQNNQRFEGFEFHNNIGLTISPKVFCERPLDDDENFESAFEESFDTEERERREKVERNKNIEEKFMDLFDINLNKTHTNGDDILPINLPIMQTESQTFIADLDKNVREIKEGLNFVSEKLDSVVGHMDKTLGDPNISEDNLMTNNKFGHLYTSIKSTQTPVSWLKMKTDVVTNQNKDEQKVSNDEKKKRDFMFDRKYILRQRIDTLKEYTRIQLYLIRQEQHTASLVNKEYFSNKFKKLMSDFDAEKRKIKMELLGNLDKFTLIEHFNKMFKQQEETNKLIACFKAKQELKFMEFQHNEYSPNIRLFPNEIEKEQHQIIQQVNPLEANIEEVSDNSIEASDDDLDTTLNVFDAIQSSKNFDNSDSSTPKKLTPNVPLLDFTLLSINEDLRRKNHAAQQVILNDVGNSNIPDEITSINANVAQCPLEFLANMALTNKEDELNKNIAKLHDQQEDEQKSDSVISSPSVDENSTNGNTSEDITSLPFVSENVVKSSNNDEDQEPKQTNSTTVQSTRVKNLENIVSAQEQLIVQISHRSELSEPKIVNNTSLFDELIKVVEVIEEHKVENEPLHLNSTRNYSDSILEEIQSPKFTESTSNNKNQELLERTKTVKSKSLNSSERERTSAEIESIPEEIISIRNGEDAGSLSSSNIISITPSKADQIQHQELNNYLDDHITSRDVNKLNESLNSTLENVSEEIVSSFKPSEKSLRSILSSLPNSSLGTGRDSLSRRRSSASEALIKLRTMNIVPALPRSPPRQKSPPRTPRSPIERYLTKFPQNLTSRESISNDEIFVLRQSLGPVELLEDLPNASQLGMVLDLSHSPIASLPDVSTLIKKDEYAKEKEFIEKYVNSLWKPFIESGEIVIDSLSECQFSFMNSLSDSLKISKDFLQQLCYERWFNLIQNANRHLSSKQILSTEENLTGYLQKEILAPFVDKLEREIIPNGIKARAEKTSHLALDINRLLLAQYVYENLTI